MINLSDLVLLVVLFAALAIGSVTDMKKREVPDWISYSLIAAGLGLRLSYSLLTYNWSYIINGIAGFAIFAVIAYIMFFAGQWGGGDTKIIMGIGAILGIDILKFNLLESTALSFFTNMLFMGAAFGILFSIYLAIRNKDKFKKEFIAIVSEPKNRKAALAMTLLLIAFLAASTFSQDILMKIMFGMMSVLTLPLLYLIFFIKSVEKSCMIKYVKPTELTEGDWLVNDIKINGKRICGPKDLGIEKEQIDCLIENYKKGKIKKILIKEGVPFVPSFLIAMIVTIIYGNWFLLMFL